MRVICTAGSRQHGKTRLTQALMQHGAHLPPCTLTDVPGGEDWLSHAPGTIDLLLLVVAADEGLLPASRDALLLAELLNIPAGVVALTHLDTAESEEWVGLVEAEARELLSQHGLSDWEVVRVAGYDAEGLAPLIRTLQNLLQAAPLCIDNGQPILPIEEVFTQSGLGTMVKGRVRGGCLRVGDTLLIQPSGLLARIRGLQVGDNTPDTAPPDSYVVVNLAGVERSEVKRGDVLSLPGLVGSTTRLDMTFTPLHEVILPERVIVVAGTAQTTGQIQPLEPPYLRLMLDAPLAIWEGGAVFLRSQSETLGGGRVLDPLPDPALPLSTTLERLHILAEGSPAARLAFTIQDTPYPAESVAPALADELQSAYGFILFDGVLIHAERLHRWGERAAALLDTFHRENPLLLGMDAAELLRQLGLPEGMTAVLKALEADDVLTYERLVSLPGRGMRFTKAQRAAIQALIQDFDAEPYNPPSHKDAVARVGTDVLKALLAQRELIFLRPDVLLRPEVYAAFIAYARQQLETAPPLTVANLRDHFGTTRRIALPFLDHLEAQGITRRVDEGHILKAGKWENLLS